MISPLPSPCWVLDLGARGAAHYATRGDAERAAVASRSSVWPVRAATRCWTATCSCGAGLLALWEAEWFVASPVVPLHRSKQQVMSVQEATRGLCPWCTTHVPAQARAGASR